jgi:hypothetical protein
MGATRRETVSLPAPASTALAVDVVDAVDTPPST